MFDFFLFTSVSSYNSYKNTHIHILLETKDYLNSCFTHLLAGWLFGYCLFGRNRDRDREGGGAKGVYDFALCKFSICFYIRDLIGHRNNSLDH